MRMRTLPDRAGAILSRLLRPDRHPVLRLLEDQPLIVADILAATPQRTTNSPARTTTGRDCDA